MARTLPGIGQTVNFFMGPGWNSHGLDGAWQQKTTAKAVVRWIGLELARA